MFNRTPLLYKESQTKRKMEEKKISEQESLELINQMIEQTRRDSTVGSGNTFLIWGYVCMVVSLAVFVAAYTGPGAWGWLYLGIPVMGGTATLIAGRKKKNAPSTYTSKSINSIWACLAGVFCRLCFLQSRVLGRDGRLVGNVSAGIVAARYRNLLHRHHSEGRAAEAVRLDRCHDGSGLPA